MCSNIPASPAYGAYISQLIRNARASSNYPHESSYLLQAFEETPTHMSIKINKLEEGHNSYPLVCRRPAETVFLHK
jgi:hypothetical protein